MPSRCLVDDDGHTTIVKIGDQEDAGIKELLQALDPSRFADSNQRERRVVLIQWKGNGLPVSHLAGHVSFTETISNMVQKVNISICANEDNNIDLKTLRDELDKIIATGNDGEYPDYSMYEVRTLVNEGKKEKGKMVEDKPLTVPERFESLGKSYDERPLGHRGHYEYDRETDILTGLTFGQQDGSGDISDEFRAVVEQTTPTASILPSTPNVCPSLRYSHKPPRSASRIPGLDETPRSSRTPVSAYSPPSAEASLKTSVASRAKLFEQKASEIAASNLTTPKRNYRFNVRPAAILTTPTRVTTAPSSAATKSAPVNNTTEVSDDEDIDNDSTPKFKRQNSVRRSLRPFLKRRPQTPIRIPLAFSNNGSSSPKALHPEDDAPISRLAVDLAVTPPREPPITESAVSSNQTIPNHRRTRQTSLDGSETATAEAIARSISEDINALHTGDSTSLVDEVFEENDDTIVSTPPASPPNNEEEIDDTVVPRTPVVDYLDTIAEEVDGETVATDTEDAAALIAKIFKPVHGSHGSLTDDHRSEVESVGVIEKHPPSPVDFSPITEHSPDSSNSANLYSAKSGSHVTEYSELTESTQIPTDESDPLKSPPPVSEGYEPLFESFKTADASLLGDTSGNALDESTLHKAHCHVVEYPEMDGFVVEDDEEDVKHPWKSVLSSRLKARNSVQKTSKSETTDNDTSAVVVPKKVSVTDRVKSLNLKVSQNGEEGSAVPRKPWLNASKKAVVNLATSKKTSSHCDSVTTTHESHSEEVEKSVETRVLDDGSIETITTIETIENVETTEHTVMEETVEELVSTTIVTEFEDVVESKVDENCHVHAAQSDVKLPSDDETPDDVEDQKPAKQFEVDPFVVESAEPVPAEPTSKPATTASSFSFKDLKTVLAKEIPSQVVAPPSPAISHDTVESVIIEENDLASLPDENGTHAADFDEQPHITNAGDAKLSKLPVPVSKKRKNKKNKKNKP
uniref:ADF-H domain-containing protein n=1 Tax=Panagrellus redivivus TaxID=6233 RepID=A0A7E4UVE5_PANRE